MTRGHALPDIAAADDLTRHVSHLISSKQLFPPDGHVLAAVSGGADSLAMLLVLAELRTSLGFSLHALHVHHGLRGRDADTDREFVRDWCRRLDIPFHERAVDVQRFAAEKKSGLELAARQARHALYQEVADCLSAAAGQDGQEERQQVRVALAHHLDDQAETLMINLGRGTGLDGLSGMPLTDGFLVRPFLFCRRAVLERYLKNRGVCWRHDKTNDEDFTIRNRLRHTVLPGWQTALGYDPAPLLARAAENIAADRDFLQRQAEAAFADCIQGKTLDVVRLLALHPALQARVIRLFWAWQTGSRQNLEQVHVHQALSWLSDAVTGQWLDLPGQRRLLLQYGRLYLITAGSQTGYRPQLPIEGLELALPGTTRIESLNMQVVAKFVENGEEIVYNGAVECFWLDKLQGCRLRRRLPGDRIQPYGRSGSRPVKKILQEKRIASSERPDLLLLACGNDVAWLPGMASGAAYTARSGDQAGRKRICLFLQTLNRENGNNRAGR